MPDLQNFSVTPLAPVQATMPHVQIACQVTDSATGAVLDDFTGAAAIDFPAVVATLTEDEQAQLLDAIVQSLIWIKAGLRT